MEIKRYTHDQFEWDVVRCTVDTDIVGFASLQDIHYGAPGFKQRSFEKLVEYIYLNKIVWVYTGDGPDNATKNSVASPYESTAKPNDQLKYLEKTLSLIKDTCVGVLEGNHEARTKKQSDFDFTDELAERLGVEYYGHELFGIISKRTNAGGVGYTFYANHSSGGNKSPGLDANTIQRDWLQWNENIDIFIRAHTHHPYVIPVGAAVFDVQNTCVRQRERWLYNAGSFLARPKGYAAKKPYGLQPNVYYTLELDMKKNHKNVEAIKHQT